MAKDEVVVKIVSKDETKKGVKDAEKSFKGLAATVTKLAVAGFGVAAIKSFGEAVLAANVEAQSLNASLISVTGSQDAAAKSMKMLKNFASQTPFQLNQVTDAFIKMKALGLDASEEALRSYGNTASAMGKDLNQMIEAVADASTGEFERLKEFGIKSKSEGDKVSFTFQGVTTTVKKSAEDITKFLRSIGEEKFGDAMSNQMDTLGGSISNLEDAWNAFLVSVGEAGVADTAADSINLLTESLRNFGGALDLFKEFREGKIGLWDWVTANPEDAQKLLADAAAIDDRLHKLTESFDELLDHKSGNFWWTAEEEASLVKAREDLALYQEELKLAQTAQSLSGGTGGDGSVTKVEETPLNVHLAIQEASQIEDIWLGHAQRMAEIKAEEDAAALSQTIAQGEQLKDFWQFQADDQVAIEKRAADTIADNKLTAEQSLQSALGVISGLMNSESEKAFNIGKVASIAEATINTYKGATAAYASLAGTGPYGPALGAVAAAAAIAAGLANVQKISATTFQGGGGGGGGGGDFSGGTGGGAGSGSGAGLPELTELQAGETPANQLPQLPPLVIEGGGIMGKLMEDEIWPELEKMFSRGFTLNVE